MLRISLIAETWGRFERLRSEAKDRREDDGTVPVSPVL